MDQETTEPERLEAKGRLRHRLGDRGIVVAFACAIKRDRVTGRGWTGTGVHPAMLRAHARAFALSVTLGNRRRSSIAADNSPS